MTPEGQAALERLAEIDEEIRELERKYHQQMGAKEMLAENKAEILRLCRELGVDPNREKIQQELERLEAEVTQSIKAIDRELRD